MSVPVPKEPVIFTHELSPAGRSLLATLESARDLLSYRLLQEQITVTGPDLNTVVISSILQVMFLRAGQDFGFVSPDTLGLLAECDGISKRMGRACSDAGLGPEKFFDVGPDGPRLLPAIPDPALRELIGRASLTDFPGPLTSISPDELAVVLEHFVAMRLEVAEGYRVKKTGKSAVLYTGSVDVPPSAVVKGIVNVTLRGVMRGLPPGKAPAILDPACGAGIFLLAAYRFLAGGSAGALPADARNVACRSLFGVDIDPESVSAARFVLLLGYIDMVLKSGAGAVTANTVREVAAGLVRNIRCGNALIAPDFFTGRPVHPFDAQERRRINPFDWDTTFPAILTDGGFDAVIGAPPPYRPFPVQAREAYFQMRYSVYAPSSGMYGYFIEKGFTLLRPGGAMAILVPATFLRIRSARGLRRLILTRQIEVVGDTGRTRLMQGSEERVFLLRLSNQRPDRPFVVAPVPGNEGSFEDVVSGARGFLLDQRSLGDGGWILKDTRAGDLLMKLKKTGTPLDHSIMGEFVSGEHRIRDNPLIVKPETREDLAKRPWCRRFFVPLLRSADIRRYVPAEPSRFVIAIRNPKQLRKCRALERYLENEPGYAGIPAVDEKTGGPGNILMDQPVSGLQSDRKIPKIIFGAFQHNPAFAYDPAGSFAITTSLIAIPCQDPVLVAILNSSLGRFIIMHTCPLTDRGYNLGPVHLGKFPVIAPDFDRLPEKKRHARIAALVTQMLAHHDYLQNAKTSQERRLILQEIESIDVKIDALVYELYGLTPEEIAAVEESLVAG